jgi:hypothetical protein
MNPKIDRYAKAFDKACTNTKSLGLIAPELNLSGSLPDRNTIINLCQIAFPTTSHMAHNCPHTVSLQGLLAGRGFNPGQITIGYLSYDNELEYECSIDSLSKEIDSDSHNPINMHVWITFPDGCILDPTLLASFENDAGRLHLRNISDLVIHGRCDMPDIPIEFEYFPLLIGTDFLKRTGSIIDIDQKQIYIGSKLAIDKYIPEIVAGKPLSWDRFMCDLKEKHPENYRSISLGVLNQLRAYIDNGLIKKDLINGEHKYLLA